MSDVKWENLKPDTKTDIIANLRYSNSYLDGWNPNTLKEWFDDTIDLMVPLKNMPVEALYSQGQETHGLSERNLEELKGILGDGDLDPIIVDGDKFEDGFHRLTAYHDAGRKTIPTLDIHNLKAMDWRGILEEGKTASLRLSSKLKSLAALQEKFWITPEGSYVAFPVGDEHTIKAIEEGWVEKPEDFDLNDLKHYHHFDWLTEQWQPLLEKGFVRGGVFKQEAYFNCSRDVTEAAKRVMLHKVKETMEEDFQVEVEIQGEGSYWISNKMALGRFIQALNTPEMALASRLSSKIEGLDQDINQLPRKTYIRDSGGEGFIVDQNADGSYLVSMNRRVKYDSPDIREVSPSEIKAIFDKPSKTWITIKTELSSTLNKVSITLSNKIESLKVAAIEDQTFSPEFMAWFGDSKVVDEDGNPKRVYHGTSASEFSEFKGLGVAGWFSEDPSIANNYAEERGVEEERIYPVYLSVKYPFDFVALGLEAETQLTPNEFAEKTGLDILSEGAYDEDDEETHPVYAYFDEVISDPSFNETYDGIYIKEKGALTWGVLEATQIKSAIGNKGSFDPSNPDITAVKQPAAPKTLYRGVIGLWDASKVGIGHSIIWATESKEDAEDYVSGQPTAQVVKVSLDLKNPADLDKDRKAIKIIADLGLDPEDVYALTYSTEAKAALMSAGYDGVTVYHYVFDAQHYGVFDPTQIKEKGNPSNPDITARLQQKVAAWERVMLSSTNAFWILEDGTIEDVTTIGHAPYILEKFPKEFAGKKFEADETEEINAFALNKGYARVIEDEGGMSVKVNDKVSKPAWDVVVENMMHTINENKDVWLDYSSQSFTIKTKRELNETLKKVAAITLDIKKGDEILTGKWKNHKEKVKTITKGKDGMPEINGKPICKIRIPKLMPKKVMAALLPYLRLRQKVESLKVADAPYERGERNYSGGVPTKSEGEAGYGIYAYPSNNAQMRAYYTKDGEDIVKIYPKNATILDLTTREAEDAIIAIARKMTPNSSITRQTIQKHKWAIMQYVYEKHPDAYLIRHSGPDIPSGLQLVIINEDAFEYQKGSEGSKVGAKDTVFLGGECKTDWRDEIIKEFKDSLELIDPVDPDWDPEVNIYQELQDMATSDEVIFFKGGEGSKHEKEFLDAIGKDYEEFKNKKDLQKHLDTLTSKVATIETSNMTKEEKSNVLNSQTFYHGTKADIDVPILSHVGKGLDTGGVGLWGNGIYLTNDKGWANSFAHVVQGEGTPKVLTLKTKVQNPLIIDLSHPEKWTEDEKYLSSNGWPNSDRTELASWALSKGYDAIALNSDSVGIDEVVVLKDGLITMEQQKTSRVSLQTLEGFRFIDTTQKKLREHYTKISDTTTLKNNMHPELDTTAAKDTVFLGGECKTDWRDDIIKEFKDSLELIDPVDPDWEPETNIYQELQDMATSDEVVFFKGGEGTKHEKEFLDAIGKDYESFKNKKDLKKHLEDISASKEGWESFEDPNSTENEARKRLIDPKEFDQTTFRRWNKFKGLEAPDGIQFLVGKLKTGEQAVQTLRFNKFKVSPKEAEKFFESSLNSEHIKKTWTEEDWKKDYPDYKISTLKNGSVADPFEYQDSNQEEVIHMGWGKGNSYRFILEGSGDIFRELSKTTTDPGYVNEKIRRLKGYFEDVDHGIHPEDSFETSYDANKDKFETMKQQWQGQPTTSEEQKVAVKLNLALLEGDFDMAKTIVSQIEGLIKTGANKTDLQTGIEIEREHKSTYDKLKEYYAEQKKWPSEDEFFKWIALNHLDEYDNYYKELPNFEEHLKKAQNMEKKSAIGNLDEKVDVRGYFDYIIDGKEYEIEYSGVLWFGDSANSMDDTIELTSDEMPEELFLSHQDELEQKALDIAHDDYYESKGIKKGTIMEKKSALLDYTQSYNIGHSAYGAKIKLASNPFKGVEHKQGGWKAGWLDAKHSMASEVTKTARDSFWADCIRKSDGVTCRAEQEGDIIHVGEPLQPHNPFSGYTRKDISIKQFNKEYKDWNPEFLKTENLKVADAKGLLDSRVPIRITNYGTGLNGKFGVTGVITFMATPEEIESNKQLSLHKDGYIVIEYLDGEGKVINKETVGSETTASKVVALSDGTILTIYDKNSLTEGWDEMSTTTLKEFFEANVDMDRMEQARIRQELESKGEVITGGGAAPAFLIKKAVREPQPEKTITEYERKMVYDSKAGIASNSIRVQITEADGTVSQTLDSSDFKNAVKKDCGLGGNAFLPEYVEKFNEMYSPRKATIITGSKKVATWPTEDLDKEKKHSEERRNEVVDFMKSKGFASKIKSIQQKIESLKKAEQSDNDFSSVPKDLLGDAIIHVAKGIPFTLNVADESRGATEKAMDMVLMSLESIDYQGYNRDVPGIGTFVVQGEFPTLYVEGHAGQEYGQSNPGSMVAPDNLSVALNIAYAVKEARATGSISSEFVDEFEAYAKAVGEDIDFIDEVWKSLRFLQGEQGQQDLFDKDINEMHSRVGKKIAKIEGTPRDIRDVSFLQKDVSMFTPRHPGAEVPPERSNLPSDAQIPERQTDKLPSSVKPSTPGEAIPLNSVGEPEVVTRNPHERKELQEQAVEQKIEERQAPTGKESKPSQPPHEPKTIREPEKSRRVKEPSRRPTSQNPTPQGTPDEHPDAPQDGKPHSEPQKVEPKDSPKDAPNDTKKGPDHLFTEDEARDKAKKEKEPSKEPEKGEKEPKKDISKMKERLKRMRERKGEDEDGKPNKLPHKGEGLPKDQQQPLPNTSGTAHGSKVGALEETFKRTDVSMASTRDFTAEEIIAKFTARAKKDGYESIYQVHSGEHLPERGLHDENKYAVIVDQQGAGFGNGVYETKYALQYYDFTPIHDTEAGKKRKPLSDKTVKSLEEEFGLGDTTPDPDFVPTGDKYDAPQATDFTIYHSKKQSFARKVVTSKPVKAQKDSWDPYDVLKDVNLTGSLTKAFNVKRTAEWKPFKDKDSDEEGVAALKGSKVYDKGSTIGITVPAGAVYTWGERWPGNSLPDENIFFEFEKDGDLIDMQPQLDGEDVLALSHDAYKYAVNKLQSKKAAITLPFTPTEGWAQLKGDVKAFENQSGYVVEEQADNTFTVYSPNEEQISNHDTVEQAMEFADQCDKRGSKVAAMQTFAPSREDKDLIEGAMQNDLQIGQYPVWKKFLTFSEGSSNKFHYFAVFPTTEGFVAANAHGKIGYTPVVTKIGEFESKEEAIASAESKMETKLKKGYDFATFGSKVAGEKDWCQFCGRTLDVKDHRCAVCEAKQGRGETLTKKYPHDDGDLNTYKRTYTAAAEPFWLGVMLDSNTNRVLLLPCDSEDHADQMEEQLKNASDVTIFAVDVYGTTTEERMREVYLGHDIIMGNPRMTVGNIYKALKGKTAGSGTSTPDDAMKLPNGEPIMDLDVYTLFPDADNLIKGEPMGKAIDDPNLGVKGDIYGVTDDPQKVPNSKLCLVKYMDGTPVIVRYDINNIELN